MRRPGLLLGTVPRAIVTAPWPATIRYAGPLLDLGTVVILEPGDGYLLVLAGLSEVYGTLGTVLAAGDPVGLVGGQSPGAQEILIESAEGSGQARSETLYIELRTREGPIDPTEWFAETKG